MLLIQQFKAGTKKKLIITFEYQVYAIYHSSMNGYVSG